MDHDLTADMISEAMYRIREKLFPDREETVNQPGMCSRMQTGFLGSSLITKMVIFIIREPMRRRKRRMKNTGRQ